MGGRVDSIYVQIDIACPIDRLWELTQTPGLHQQWDLRFTEIQYLPRPDITQPQRFLYATRVGFGLKICGEGESVGSRAELDGDCSSALKFWSDDPKSLIRTGSGYWKYLPSIVGQSTRFITSYDYSVRFGLAGRLFDRLLFRPLMGWATAWSFDRLRLWIEKGIVPAASMRQSLIYLTARLSLAMIWLYQGIIPKLIMRHPGELAMLRDAGLSGEVSHYAIMSAGWFEVGVGFVLILAWRSLWPLWFVVAAMPIALIIVAIDSPRFLSAPFNPATLNLAVLALAVIALFAARDLPSASRCLRRPPKGE